MEKYEVISPRFSNWFTLHLSLWILFHTPIEHLTDEEQTKRLDRVSRFCRKYIMLGNKTRYMTSEELYKGYK